VSSKATTLLDIANHAGVSLATAARALSAKGYVASDAKARVEESAKILGYRPNVLARGLRAQRSFTIGHIIHGITDNPFFAHVARSVEQEALAKGYKVFLYNQDGTDEQERAGVERFIERRAEAVIFTYARDVRNLALLRAAAMPVVQIERDRSADTDAVLVDNEVGSQAAVRHLVELGHRRIAFIGGDPAIHPRSFSQPRSVEEQRLDGYVNVLRESGIPIDENLIQLGPYIVHNEHGENVAGYIDTRRLLSAPSPPTAIFTGCDIIATGIMQALYEARLRVPDDISVIGFDDTLAPLLAPRLTTVAQPMAELGQTAVQFALAAIDNPAGPQQRAILPTRLVIRDSTAAPPRSTHRNHP
jgi:LacI family transcriptional regulator